MDFEAEEKTSYTSAAAGDKSRETKPRAPRGPPPPREQMVRETPEQQQQKQQPKAARPSNSLGVDAAAGAAANASSELLGEEEHEAAPPRKAPQVSSGVFSACAKPCQGGYQVDDLEAGDERISYPAADTSMGPAYEDPGFAMLENEPAGEVLGDDSDEEFERKSKVFVKRFKDVNKELDSLKTAVCVLLVVAGGLTVSLAVVAYHILPHEYQAQVAHVVMLGSIPIVACLFTWFHIWMAIQMMFRPLEFFGLWQLGDTGMGIGWQGVVPRKAISMASTGYRCARPHLMGPQEIMDSVNAKKLVEKVREPLVQVLERAMHRVGEEHYPWTKGRFAHTERSIAKAAVERIIESAPVLWRNFSELLNDEKRGIDNDGMFVKVFSENKELLNSFFLSLGEREFRFIEHCGAVMGFCCGVMQLVAFNQLSGTGRKLFLPMSGFFLGIFSNWLAIQMVFKPTHPIPVRIFGWHIYDIQGLFLKRQHDVAELYSKMVVDNFLSFNQVVAYLQTRDELWELLKEAYSEHNARVMKDTLGVLGKWLAPSLLGQAQFNQLEESLKFALVKGLSEAKDIHKIAGRHIAKVTGLEEKTAYSLRQMPAEEFENLLHPVFQEDEWILVLLGGVLGVLVGIGQIYVLSN